MTTKRTVLRISRASARGSAIAIVVSRYNGSVTSRLLKGAKDCLKRHGAGPKDVEVFRCPGAFELPQVAELLASTRSWDAIICLGAVIRGETPHFDYVASECARGIQSVALKEGVPVLFGVLTTDTEKQARERAGGTLGNKGWEAALAALDMIEVFRSIKRLQM